MTFYVDPLQDVKVLRDDRDIQADWTASSKGREGTACRIYRVQAGVYRDRESAEAVAKQLKALGFHAFVL